tara:strand:- start:806 stop:1210 length:405 start_codon:yes stop_codon:yes gene_type:complete
MKKSDLKKVIKPLVKECIHEVLIEEGLLSNIVSEVATGLGKTAIVEQKPVVRAPIRQDHRQQVAAVKEQKESLLNAINKDAYNGVDLFEGTEPMTSYEAQNQGPGAVDLGDPRDSGVDISSIVGVSSQIWKKLK